MIYRNLEDSDIVSIYELWEESIKDEIFKLDDYELFKNKIYHKEYYNKEGTVVVEDINTIIGFGICYFISEERSHIGMIVVNEKYRKQGVGTKILNLLEEYLINKNAKYIRNFYVSPLNFRWNIPLYGEHYHTGCPAILINSKIYFLLANNGYNIESIMDGYHINLKNFEFSKKIKERKELLEKEGITIEYYNKNNHLGLKEFFERLNNKGFERTALSNAEKENPSPMLVVIYDNKVYGWTGPLSVDNELKASFGGIAVDERFRSKGVGKVLFSSLCQGLKDMGGEYTTLFTGVDNVARNIYLSAGFKIVMSFALMKKSFV